MTTLDIIIEPPYFLRYQLACVHLASAHHPNLRRARGAVDTHAKRGLRLGFFWHLSLPTGWIFHLSFNWFHVRSTFDGAQTRLHEILAMFLWGLCIGRGFCCCMVVLLSMVGRAKFVKSQLPCGQIKHRAHQSKRGFEETSGRGRGGERKGDEGVFNVLIIVVFLSSMVSK
ncbi:hypothetical protein B0T22DRAFT_262982 [Podospora appendiculata]|uniref:Uncharacterized protein n=1 Tax=Podospora appendiculata TaxID=314037 RepID=A0AAE0X310_9PEZI|nr:hypothetical protein B0T22DRAFT_262982 [Podospora appendiculata]